MANLMELKRARAFAINKAEAIVNAAGEHMTEAQENEYELAMSAVTALNPQIAKIEKQNTLSQHLVNGKLIPAAGNLRQARTPNAPVVLSEEYYNSFFAEWLPSRGSLVSAAMYEGAGSAGGFTVPTIWESQVVPLAATEMGVRTAASVIATANDIKVPRGLAFGTAAGKAESGASDNYFTGTDPTLEQFTLSAFMAGSAHSVSFELLQDVPSFIQFAMNDGILALQMYEGNLFVNGTGTGQAQGLIGNTGAGVTGVAAGSDTYASELLTATFSVQALLNAAYYKNAKWLMSRATGVAIRKAQSVANLFTPVWTRENGKDYLHGFEVVFDGFMPTIASGHTPVLFGSFVDGYLIGDRGGSGINVKILDQPKATEGQVVLLFYRRTDGRVRRSEAIQAITLA